MIISKKIALYIIGCCSYITAFAQDKPFTLQVKAGTDVNSAVLIRYSLKAGQKKDTITATNGMVNFSGLVNDERQKAQLFCYDNENKMTGNLMFYLEPGNITITRNAASKSYIIGGTPLNRDLEQYNREFNKLIGAHMPGEEEGEIVMQDRRLEVVRRFVVKHPASLVGLDALDEYAAHNKKPASIDTIFNLLAKKLQTSSIGKQISDRVKGMKSAAVGDPAPPFSLPDTNGKMVSLSDFRGKYVLIDFWATWCGPCMAEMPNLKEAYSRYHNKNFEILGVSLDRPDSKELWLKVIARDQLIWPQVSDLKWWNSKAALFYNITSVPSNFLVAPDGTIVATQLRGEALQKKLSEIL